MVKFQSKYPEKYTKIKKKSKNTVHTAVHTSLTFFGLHPLKKFIPAKDSTHKLTCYNPPYYILYLIGQNFGRQNFQQKNFFGVQNFSADKIFSTKSKFQQFCQSKLFSVEFEELIAYGKTTIKQ